MAASRITATAVPVNVKGTMIAFRRLVGSRAMTASGMNTGSATKAIST
jgi:hypothetical protein